MAWSWLRATRHFRPTASRSCGSTWSVGGMLRYFDKIPGLVLLVLVLAPLAYMPLNSAEPFKAPAEFVIVTMAWVFAFVVEVQAVWAGRSIFAGARGAACKRWVAALAVWLLINALLGVAPTENAAYAGTVIAYL